MSSPSKRRRIMYTNAEDYGETQGFRLVGKDRSDSAGYTSTVNVWHTDTKVKIITAGACTATLSGSDTLVEYTIQDGDFPDDGDYVGRIRWTKLDYSTQSRPFSVQVLEATP